MANEEKKLVEIENLRKYFPIKGTNGPGVQAVQDVSLYIKKGETLGLVGVSFALMFDIPADIFFRYRSDRFHIIGMVPQLPFPKLVSYFRKTFEKFPAGDPLQVFHNRSYG